MASFFTPTLKNTRVSSTTVDSSGVHLAISVYFCPRVWRLSESHRKPRNTSQMGFHCWSFALLLVPRANLVVFVEYCMVRGLPGVHKQGNGTHRLNQRKDLRPDEPNVECCAASPLRPLYLLAWPRQRRRALRRGLVSTCHFTKSIRTEEPWGVDASIVFLYGPLGSQGDSCPGNIAPSPPVEWRQLLSLVDVMGIQEY